MATRVSLDARTETQGRIHTSACTIAVLAGSDEVEAAKDQPIGLAHLDTFRASGGQHINKDPIWPCVSPTSHRHRGRGAQDGRSQHNNKDPGAQGADRPHPRKAFERAAKDATEAQKSLWAATAATASAYPRRPPDRPPHQPLTCTSSIAV